MRVALCISGQMRTFREVYRSQVEYLAKPFRADVFVHTWNKTGTTNKLILSLPRGFHIKMPGDYWHDNPDVFSESVCSFEAAFPNLYREMQRALRADDDVTVEELMDIYGAQEAVVEDFNDVDFNGKLKIESLRELVADATLFNAAPMFYKINACDKLRTKHALRLRRGYDLVIRLRPDMMFFSPMKVDNLAFEGKVMTLHNPFYEIIGRDDLANDMMFLGDSATMSYASGLWNELPSYWNPALHTDWEFGTRGPEKILKHYLQEAGLGDDVLKLDPAPQRIVGYQLSYEKTLELLRKDLLLKGHLPDFTKDCIAVIQSIHAIDLVHAGQLQAAVKVLENAERVADFIASEPWAGRAKLASIQGADQLPELREKVRASGQEAVFPELFS